MAEEKMDTVIGVFSDHKKADQAVHQLMDAGYRAEEISVMMKAPPEGEKVAGTQAAMTRGIVSETAGGVGKGALIGGLAGLLIGVIAITVPGLGALLVTGPLAEALGVAGATATTVTGAVLGGATGGLIGLFEGFGVTREQAKEYERSIKEGAVILAVPVKPEMENKAEDIMNKNNAEQVRVVTPSS